MPLPDVDLRLVDVETGRRDVDPGEQGEILIRAPQLMRGYWCCLFFISGGTLLLLVNVPKGEGGLAPPRQGRNRQRHSFTKLSG